MNNPSTRPNIVYRFLVHCLFYGVTAFCVPSLWAIGLLEHTNRYDSLRFMYVLVIPLGLMYLPAFILSMTFSDLFDRRERWEDDEA